MADIYDISSYNFGNVLDTDIGMMNMDKTIQVPSFISEQNPYFGTMSGINIQGKLDSDKVVITSQKEKDNRFWKALLLGGALVGLGVVGYKLCKTGLSKVWTGIKSLASKFKK